MIITNQKFAQVLHMASMLTELWTRLFGRSEDREGGDPSVAPVEYKGYRIRPAPYPARGQYQTAGMIEKDHESGAKEYRFVRAETHSNKDDAAAFAIIKAKQIIDEQGDQIFG